ncbi:MAG: hypothetical protein LR001_09380 [Clostridiales bacterium]|nr:hypothetical protein [Clostridiales bacterium]
MHKDEYVSHIRKKLARYFDIEENKEYEGMGYDLIAKSFIRSEKYLGSKKIIIYAMENTEHTFIKCYNEINENTLTNYLDTLVKATSDLVKLNHDHMCTIITGVIVVDGQIDEEIKKKIHVYKYEKSFMFGLKGWSYIRLLVVQLKVGEVLANKRGLEAKKFYDIKK